MSVVQAQLVDEIALAPIGAPAELFLVPARNGRPAQFIWMESMGIFMSKIFLGMMRKPGKGIKAPVVSALRTLHLPPAYTFRHLRNENVDLFCMTLTDSKGKLLWQEGKRSDRPNYCNHMSDSLVGIADINGDGNDEIVAVCGPGRIGIFDLRTGKSLKEVKLATDNFTTIRLAKTGPRSTDWTILAAASDAGYPPFTYSNPTLLLDTNLKILKQLDLSAGAGHTPQVFDADGDGFDEFLVGYTLIDHDGRIVWVAEGFEDKSTINAEQMHADHIVLIDSDKPGRWRAAIAGSDLLYMFDSNGRKLWEHKGEHPQYLFVGKLHPQNLQQHLFLLNCRISMELIDMDGKGVWKGHLPGHWPLGRPEAVRGDGLFHMSVPGTLWRSPSGGKDFIVYNEAGYPYGIDGMGNVVAEFPCPATSRQPEYKIPRNHRPDDYGYGYRSLVADVDGDGNQEVVIYDRRFAWVYKI